MSKDLYFCPSSPKIYTAVPHSRVLFGRSDLIRFTAVP